MQGQVGKVIIGKDISRTGSLVIGGSGDLVANGEVIVLDSNRNIMSAGTTYADTKTIYIAEGLSTTYGHTNEAGTSVTGVQKLLYSDPIDGSGVFNYTGKAYTAPVEQVWTVDLTGWVPVVGTEYTFKIVYKDLTNNDYPTQYSHSYNHIATTATLATELSLIVAMVNADTRRRVVATEADSTDLILTALPYDDNTEVDSINEYAQVIFDVGLTSDNFDTYTSSAQTTAPTKGHGYYKIVRDEERWATGNEGILNRTKFPVKAPTMRTVLDETYDTIVIDHKNWYTASASKQEQVAIKTKIFIPYTATSNQMDSILAVLNPWMASLPKPFDSVSF